MSCAVIVMKQGLDNRAIAIIHGLSMSSIGMGAL